jgi:hypothetical protein
LFCHEFVAGDHKNNTARERADEEAKYQKCGVHIHYYAARSNVAMHIALPGRELRASPVTKQVHWEVPSEQRSLDALRWVLIPSARAWLSGMEKVGRSKHADL